jgi:hypothetical protein
MLDQYNQSRWSCTELKSCLLIAMIPHQIVTSNHDAWSQYINVSCRQGFSEIRDSTINQIGFFCKSCYMQHDITVDNTLFRPLQQFPGWGKKLKTQQHASNRDVGCRHAHELSVLSSTLLMDQATNAPVSTCPAATHIQMQHGSTYLCESKIWKPFCCQNSVFLFANNVCNRMIFFIIQLFDSFQTESL